MQRKPRAITVEVNERNVEELTRILQLSASNDDNYATVTSRSAPPPHRVQPKVCASCHKVSDEPLPICQGCHMLAYCNEVCQRNHWKASHKVQCQGWLVFFYNNEFVLIIYIFIFFLTQP